MHPIWQPLLHNVTYTTKNTLKKLIEASLIFPLIDYGFIAISGMEAEKYLQGQLTCDINKLTENNSSLAACCNPQGQVQSIFRLFKSNEICYLRVPLPLLDYTLQRLKKYAIFSKITIEDVSNKWLAIGFSGQNIEHFLSEKFAKFPINIDGTEKNSLGIAVRAPGPFKRYEVYGEISQIKTLWDYYITQLNIATTEQWHLLEINAGIATIYPQTSEKFTPHHINLPQLNAVSFTKGCYTGQEVIARMEYRSTNKPKLCRIIAECNESPIIGGEIYKQNQAVGTIVDIAQENGNSYILLVSLKEQELNEQLFYLDKENKILLRGYHSNI